MHVARSKVISLILMFIPIQFVEFKTFAKYSGYPFFHQPTLVLSG